MFVRARVCMCVYVCTYFPFLGSALYLIRLPAMNLEEFANSAAQTGILTHQETIDLFLYFTASNKPQLCFATKPRQGLKTQVSKNHKLYENFKASTVLYLCHFIIEKTRLCEEFSNKYL